MNTTTREDIHHLIDALPEHTLDTAEAFLAFLRDRIPADPVHPEDSPSRIDKENWAAGERRGLTVRREQRGTPENGQEP
jgi:hypothetical protein